MAISRPGLNRNQIRSLAKAVHDEIYSIENTLKRRGYFYCGSGSPSKLLLPRDASPQNIQKFYEYMNSRTFRNILKSVVIKQTDITKTEYLDRCNENQLTKYFDFFCTLGLIRQMSNSNYYYLSTKINDFGPTLEWYVAELFKRELESTSNWGIRIKNINPGGDFDVMARVESTLIWVETKSASPHHITEKEIRHFLQRDQNLDPDISIFLVDTKNDLSGLVDDFRNIISPIDPWPIHQLTDFGGIYFTLWRIFITNTKPSILASLRNCLNYCFAIVAHTNYFSRDKRINFLTKN